MIRGGKRQNGHLQGRGPIERCLIACRVFKPALEHLEFWSTYPQVRLSYLPSHLHVYPVQLRERLMQQVRRARRRREEVFCLYGRCFPEIDEVCQSEGISRVGGTYCYELLLGGHRFREILKERAGTFFIEQDLLINFDEYCLGPLELFDAEIRAWYFRHYRQLVYVRQPADPDLVPRAGEVARFLSLSLEVREADYSYFGERLEQLLRR